MMSLSDKITALHAELTQRQKAQHARALLQHARSTILETDFQIQEIADSGNFNTLDTEVKQALIDAWDVVKVAKAGFENITVAELLDWSP